MRILIVQDKSELKPEMAFLKRHLKKVKITHPTAKITVLENPEEEIVNRELEKAEILIPVSISQNFNFKRAQALKWIHLISAGINNKLPEEVLNLKILVTNSSGVHPLPIAEHVLAFMLMFARQIHKAFRVQIEKREWVRNYQFLNVSELHGKTIGIVGLGRIGKKIAHLSKAFQMEVLGIVRNVKGKEKEVDKLGDLEMLDELLGKSDYLVNCLPATNETYHLFDLKKFQKMKPTAYFINIGRGQTVKESDLVRALKEGVIAGAGLDVFEKEPLPPESPLWKLENVIITSHYSGWTPYYIDRVTEIFCENLKAFLAGKPLLNLVDIKRGY